MVFAKGTCLCAIKATAKCQSPSSHILHGHSVDGMKNMVSRISENPIQTWLTFYSCRASKSMSTNSREILSDPNDVPADNPWEFNLVLRSDFPNETHERARLKRGFERGVGFPCQFVENSHDDWAQGCPSYLKHHRIRLQNWLSTNSICVCGNFPTSANKWHPHSIVPNRWW